MYKNRSRGCSQLFTRIDHDIWTSELKSKSENSATPNFAFKKHLFIYWGADLELLPENPKTQKEYKFASTTQSSFKSTCITIVNNYMYLCI